MTIPEYDLKHAAGVEVHGGASKGSHPAEVVVRAWVRRSRARFAALLPALPVTVGSRSVIVIGRW